MARIFFSIVAVCLNPGESLLVTISSVLSQQYGAYEIIVKDGGSSDGSLEKLPKDDRIRIVKSPDSGIYDAMNQALPLLGGQYVLFLNCGDLLHDDRVLARAAACIERRTAEDESGAERIFYGNQYHLGQKSVVHSAPGLNDFACYRNVPCHQVCFYDVRLFSQRGYDTQYRVRADYEHFLYCLYERKAQAVYMELVVADYEGGGFSETRENLKISAREHKKIAARYLGDKKARQYRAVLLLTLAPLRTRIAQNEKTAAVYNKAKAALYGLLGRKG